MSAAVVMSVVAAASVLMATAAVTDRSVWPSRLDEEDGPSSGSRYCYTAGEASQLIGVAGLTLWIVSLLQGALGQGYPLWQLGEKSAFVMGTILLSCVKVARFLHFSTALFNA